MRKNPYKLPFLILIVVVLATSGVFIKLSNQFSLTNEEVGKTLSLKGNLSALLDEKTEFVQEFEKNKDSLETYKELWDKELLGIKSKETLCAGIRRIAAENNVMLKDVTKETEDDNLITLELSGQFHDLLDCLSDSESTFSCFRVNLIKWISINKDLIRVLVNLEYYNANYE